MNTRMRRDLVLSTRDSLVADEVIDLRDDPGRAGTSRADEADQGADQADGDQADGDPSTGRAGGERRTTLLIAAGLAVLTAVSRIVAIGSAGQITVDEIFYTGLGHSVRLGHVPPVLLTSEPGGGGVFLLHPPGFFVLEAAWELIAGHPTHVVDQVVRARYLNAVLAVITAVVLFALGRRLAGRTLGIVAAALFIVDPFVLRQNNLVFIETATMMWLVVGLLLLVRVIQGAASRPRLEVALAGLALGFAIATKDMAGLPVLGLLLVLLVTGWCLQRRDALLALVLAIVPYALFFGSTAAQGFGDDLIDQKTIGFRRALGLAVSTGFNKEGSPSLVTKLLGDAGTFVFTYGLVAVGSLCAVALLWDRRPERRLVGLFTIGAGVLLVYSLVFGTIEEQFLYFLAVPCVLSIICVVPRLVGHGPTVRRGVRAAAVALLAVVLVWNVAAWCRVRVGSTNGLDEFVAYLRTDIPKGTPVAYTNGVLEFTLESEGYRAVPLGTPGEMKAQGVRYLAALPKEIEENYSWVTSDALARLEASSDRRFVGSTESPIVVLEARDPDVW